MFKEVFSRIFGNPRSTIFGVATGGAGFDLLITGIETGDTKHIIIGAIGALFSIAAVLFKEKAEPKV